MFSIDQPFIAKFFQMTGNCLHDPPVGAGIDRLSIFRLIEINEWHDGIRHHVGTNGSKGVVHVIFRCHQFHVGIIFRIVRIAANKEQRDCEDQKNERKDLTSGHNRSIADQNNIKKNGAKIMKVLVRLTGIVTSRREMVMNIYNS